MPINPTSPPGSPAVAMSAAGLPGEEHTSIGNDPLAGSTTEHDIGGSIGGIVATPAAEGEAEVAAKARGAYWQEAQGPGPAVVGAEILQGQTVENLAGEPLGRVERVIVDLACGRLAYLVLELTAFEGGALCAVPWPAIRVDPKDSRLRIALSPDDFHQAPTFAPEHWPSMTDERWVQEVHGFFGSRPYWI